MQSQKGGDDGDGSIKLASLFEGHIHPRHCSVSRSISCTFYIATGRLPKVDLQKKRKEKRGLCIYLCGGVCKVYVTIGIFQRRRVEFACP